MISDKREAMATRRCGGTVPMLWRAAGWTQAVVLAVVLPGCGTQTGSLPTPPVDGAPAAAAACPSRAVAPDPLPGVRPEHRQLAYWIGLTPKVDEVVLSVQQIARHNQAFQAALGADPAADPLTQRDLTRPPDQAAMGARLAERIAYLRERVKDGRYVDAAARPLGGQAAAAIEHQPPRLAVDAALRVALAPIAVHCGPLSQPLYRGPQIDKRFDRNRCGTLRPQEPLQILARAPAGLLLVRSSYTFGWVAADAPLSPPLSATQARAFSRGPDAVTQRRLSLELSGGARVEVAAGALLPRAGEGQVWVATANAVSQAAAPSADDAPLTTRPLTRRALLRAAFRYLDAPYGWGGQGAGWDCSRFIMDVLSSFGLRFPRPSVLQARAGSLRIAVPKGADRRTRLGLIDLAARRGVLLLHFPGHIMLYLGRSAEGTPMVMHAFAEYLQRCDEPAGDTSRGETLRSVDRVQVSNLELGAGSSRGSLLERVTNLVLLGAEPGAALSGLAVRRPAAPASKSGASCERGPEVAWLSSPRHAAAGQPVRVIVSSGRDLGSAALTLFGPGGVRRTPATHSLAAGPPFSYWAELSAPAAGTWQAQIGDGDRVEACGRFVVHERGPKLQAAGGAVWIPKRRTSVATERLYATWVARLFDYPFDDRTWPDLQSLLRDRAHNLLYDYLGQGEEAQLELGPDCADLPYFLRAYFSWKLRLPFAYRHCNRGRAGKAPYCDRELHDPLSGAEGRTEVAAFADFVRRRLANGVHSGTGRTAPEDELSDYYPIPLSRRALRPGTIFADPYGHLFVVAGWAPQPVGGYGLLIGADAQPDGTLGRRRFWPGSFLFTPDTSEAGAGFKAFRPLRYRGGRLRPVHNEDIGAMAGMTPFSMAQYQGSKESFYDRVEALINPRPLDPQQMMDVLLDAFYEQVKRRVVSIDNGEKYAADHRGAVDMPTGHAIFETTGPWEDYSTPSRDMRLLIAMDTVLAFPAAVRRAPARFGVPKREVTAGVGRLERRLGEGLAARHFSYRRSTGEPQQLSLADVVARAKGLEMAYNPGDCVEIRWAAPAGSAEASSCRRHAPRDQRRKMERYRQWFADRRRPAR